MAFDCVIQVPLGAPIGGGDQLVVHLHELIKGLVVGLHEETDQHGVPLGRVEEAETLDTGLRRVPGEGFLQIVVEPRQVEREHARGLNGVQLGSQTANGLRCRHAGRGLEDL